VEEHYTGCQHSTPFVPNGSSNYFNVSQYTSEVIVVLSCVNFTINNPFLPQKTVVIGFLADVSLNFLDLLGKYVCSHCFECFFVSTFTNETQFSSHVTRMM
jgi:hypothetical protein